MAPQSGLTIHLRRYICGAAKNSRMSTILSVGKETRSSGSCSRSRTDRTWKSSCGISFQSPSDITRNASQLSQTSSAEPLLSAFATQHRPDHPEQSFTENSPLLCPTQDAPVISQPLENSGYPRLSLPEEPTQDVPSYPRPRSSPVIQGPESPDTHTSSHNQESKDCFPSSSNEQFRTPLGFHIPKAKLQSAIEATPSSPSAYWQYRLYQGPGGETDKVKVHYCKTKDDTERIAQLFLEEEVIGFDIEWKSNAGASDGIRKNVALVQVASERRVALFHLARYPNASIKDDFVAPSFKTLMESPDITKVGVAIKADCTRLRIHLGIASRGLLELSHLYKLVKYFGGDVRNINKISVSLAQQVQEHLQLPLWKGEVRSSDWSQDLSHQQTQYAASDSYAGFQLFHVLEAKRKALTPTPPRPAHAELNLPIRLANEHTVATVDEASETTEAPDISSDISVEELARDVGNMAIRYVSPEKPTIRYINPPQPAVRYCDSPPPHTSPSSEQSTSLSPSPELSLANQWVDQYRLSSISQSINLTARAKPAELRAYALWHEQGLDVPTIASLLRRPPLQNSTVAGYVIKAILSDSLPYDSDRIECLKQYVGAFGVAGVNWRQLK